MIFLVGAAIEHVYNFVVNNDIQPGNVGTILLADVGVPVVALILILASRRLDKKASALR
ncbi:DUF6790 family protein [Fodinicola feengrottensis]|uniref:DUF6790 family protein n=1 Tax=Fodinicola feengrottensis TaxID=435914 RepID=UPI0013D3AD1F|nr:DUF6790 family protein [Fodinicola feengrottensis]